MEWFCELKCNLCKIKNLKNVGIYFIRSNYCWISMIYLVIYIVIFEKLCNYCFYLIDKLYFNNIWRKWI